MSRLCENCVFFEGIYQNKDIGKSHFVCHCLKQYYDDEERAESCRHYKEKDLK